MARCLQCGETGEWYCAACDAQLLMLRYDLRQLVALMGESEREGRIVLTASKVLEALERVENTTALGKVELNRRAKELLAEVTDFFLYTPYCPQCRSHRLELIPGDPIRITCHGGCVYEGDNECA